MSQINKVIKVRLKQLSDMLKALGHPSRITIMWLLCNAEEKKVTVKQIYEELKMAQAVISRHLGILRNAGLVSRSVSGQKTFYEADRTNENANKIINCFTSVK